ncbi:MAG: hypothetical protein KDA42_19375, partial [Planctomycetales bacterium]|nr:hypothetical protein [Planctomycetales bacterium]
PQPTEPDEALLAAASRAFRLVRGQKRVFPLGEILSANDGSSGLRVRQFAAGRVVDCYTEMNGTLILIVQPTLMQTATALARTGQSPNPWIGKVVRTR